LYRFRQQLTDIQLPPESQKIGKGYSEFGNLFGNSNKGDYVAAQLILSNQSQEALETFLNETTFKYAEQPSDWWPNAKKLTRQEPIVFHVIPISDVETTEDRQSLNELFLPNPRIIASAKMFGLTLKEISAIRKNKRNGFLLLVADTQYAPNEFRCR